MRLYILLCLSLPLAVLAQDPGLPLPKLDRHARSSEVDTGADIDQGPHPEYLGPTPEEVAAARADAERTAVTAIAEYLTRLFAEDSQVSVDSRLSWATGDGIASNGGVRLQFKSAKLSAEVDAGYFSPDQGGFKVSFADLVGERFSVRASVDRNFLRVGDEVVESTFDNHAVGYALGDATELEFEVFLRKDEAVGSYRDSYRAMLKHEMRNGTVFKIGLDRSYNGAPFENGESNAVVGVELPPLLLRRDRHYYKLTTKVEAMYGRSDSQAPGIRDTQTLGLSGSLGLEVGSNDRRWVVGGGAFAEQTREGLSGNGLQNRVTARGAWLYGSWKVDEQRKLYANGKYSSLRTQLFGDDLAVERSQLELGIETSLKSGKRWRLGLNTGHHNAPGGSDWSTGVTVGFSW